MSVPSVPGGWLPNSATVQNSAFASPDPSGVMHSFDPSGGVLSQSGMDQNHFQQQQQNQIQQNGNVSRTSSPGFQTPAYSVTPVVPMKRARPRDNSIDISPRPAPQGLPTSRSQTPLGQQQQQLAYQSYQNNLNQRQQFNAYNAPHLQHVGSANASPSPVMQDQQFNAQSNASNAPKRVATQSPSPFSPAPSQQGFMSQGSPPPSTLAPNASQNMNGQAMPSQQPYSQAYTQGYQSPAPTAAASPAPSMMPNQMQAQMVYAQMQAAQQQQQQHQQQQQQRQQQHMQQQRLLQHQQQQSQAGQMNQMGQASPLGPNPGMPTQQMRPGQPQQQQQRPVDTNQWMKSLQEFMTKRGTPITRQPGACGKPVNLYQLWVYVIKSGGSTRASKENRWPQIVMSLGFQPLEQYPNCVEEVVNVHREYLGAFEEQWMRSQQQRNQQQYQLDMKRQQARNIQQAQAGQQMPTGNGAIQLQQPPRPQQRTTPGPGQAPSTPARPPQNGFTPPPQGMRQATPHHQPPSTPTLSMDGSPIQAPGATFPMQKPPAPVSESSFSLSSQMPATPRDVTTDFKPKNRVLDTHGGINVKVMSTIGHELLNLRPNAPQYSELGLIDIHALTMQLKSGLTAEIRVALDTLATVSVELRQSIALESCEDLLEALVDVAEVQVELLGDHAPEGSEVIAMLPYEDVIRLCRAEQDGLVDVAPFASQEYDLERACDRLLCITTILRNLSFFESNHHQLAAPFVVRFLSSVIERLGTCHLFMRTYTNLLDFMKDTIIYLSNLSHAIILPSEDDALNFLHMVLAFAPQPLPYASGRDQLLFTPYLPSIHRYLPPAVDTLAKLLARDEPNRAFFKNIFLSETHTAPPYDLLIRAFGLAISPIPNDNNPRTMQVTVEARQPILEQALLVADLLAQIVPGADQPVARQWLSSEDGFSQSLLRLVCLLSPLIPPNMQHPTPRGQKPQPQDLNPFSRITHRGMSVLRKLAAKSGDLQDENSGLPLSIFPKKESLLGALLTVHIDGVVVKELCSFAGLD